MGEITEGDEEKRQQEDDDDNTIIDSSSVQGIIITKVNICPVPENSYLSGGHGYFHILPYLIM